MCAELVTDPRATQRKSPWPHPGGAGTQQDDATRNDASSRGPCVCWSTINASFYETGTYVAAGAWFSPTAPGLRRACSCAADAALPTIPPIPSRAPWPAPLPAGANAALAVKELQYDMIRTKLGFATWPTANPAVSRLARRPGVFEPHLRVVDKRAEPTVRVAMRKSFAPHEL